MFNNFMKLLKISLFFQKISFYYENFLLLEYQTHSMIVKRIMLINLIEKHCRLNN